MPADSSRPTLLVFADDWGRHPSSCQHLVRHLLGDYKILWANSVGTRRVRMNGFTLRRGVEKLKNWKRGVVRTEEQMWVVDLPMLPAFGSSWVRQMNRRLVTYRLSKILDRLGLGDPIVLTTLPYIANLIRDLPRRGFVYYCTDDFSHWPGADQESLQRAEQETTATADLILAVSEVLVTRFAKNRSCQYFPHGVDIQHFEQVTGSIPPKEIATLPRPHIGFFGLIYEKLDFELLAAVAKRFSSGSLVLIGPQVFCPDWFRELTNVHFLGPKPYSDLPRWIAGLDVVLLPYLNDEMIRQSDPLKLRECLASGKPTVSIDIPEVRSYEPWVRVGVTPAEFVRHVEDAVCENGDTMAMQERQRSVVNDGWDRRAADLRIWLSSLTSVSARSKAV